MCGSGVGFDPVVGGRRLTFDFYGIYNGELIFYDRETGSVWSLASGEALDGPLVGQQLGIVAILHTTWARWRALYPETRVLSDDTPYRDHYKPRAGRPASLSPAFQRTLTHVDNRLPTFEEVLAVEVDKKHRAYPLSSLEAAGGVVNDRLGRTPIVVLFEPRSRTATAFRRALGDHQLDFEPVTGLEGLALDVATGSRWRVDGRAVDGPLKGQRLEPVKFHKSAWYAWVAYFPDTSIYRQEKPEK